MSRQKQGLEPVTHTLSLPHHVKLAVLVHQTGDGEGRNTAGGQGEICVEHSSVLGILHSQRRVKARPEHPEKHGACRSHRVNSVGWDSYRISLHTEPAGIKGLIM